MDIPRLSRGPVDGELSLGDAITDPVESHVDGFWTLHRTYWCRWLNQLTSDITIIIIGGQRR
jgi:hypothetical protein